MANERMTALPPLFQRGAFNLHSGAPADWIINCDALTDSDLDTLAFLIAKKIGPFRQVIGVRRGGLRIADALKKYCTVSGSKNHLRLVVDDVLTTGASMEEMRRPGDIGAVIFARGPCPWWVTPLFSMEDKP
jgi:orotate phosphoribosyltransferase